MPPDPKDLLVDYTFAAKQWPWWFGGECSLALRVLCELGTRLQKFGVLKSPHSATARAYKLTDGKNFSVLAMGKVSNLTKFL